MKKRIAVIAGTPVDTRMGVNYIEQKDPEAEPLYLPLAENPRVCHVFQMAEEKEKHSQMKSLFIKALGMGADAFFIYCNSLSASFDFKALAEEMHVKCVTPLDAYETLAKSYKRIGLMSANNQATAGIEKTFTLANPECYVLGTGLLLLVEEIEKGFRNEGPEYTPEAIVQKMELKKLCGFYEANGCEALVLGCTHFPYIRKALESITALPVIDPADVMYRLISDACRS